MAIVYRHRRLDNNEIFYIGFSKHDSLKRAYSKHSRTVYWSVELASEYYKVSASNLRRYLNGTRKNTTTAALLKNFKIPS